MESAWIIIWIKGVCQSGISTWDITGCATVPQVSDSYSILSSHRCSCPAGTVPPGEKNTWKPAEVKSEAYLPGEWQTAQPSAGHSPGSTEVWGPGSSWQPSLDSRSPWHRRPPPHLLGEGRPTLSPLGLLLGSCCSTPLPCMQTLRHNYWDHPRVMFISHGTIPTQWTLLSLTLDKWPEFSEPQWLQCYNENEESCPGWNRECPKPKLLWTFRMKSCLCVGWVRGFRKTLPSLCSTLSLTLNCVPAPESS